jgi:hypothetical protein
MFDYSISSAPIHAPVSIVSLAGFADATSDASARLESINNLTKSKASWLSDALLSGMTPNAFKLGTILSLGWFWVRIAGCSALYRGFGMDRIDFTNIVIIANQEALVISTPGYLLHESCATYFYVVRRFNHCGDWEFTLSAAAKVSFDVNGELVKPHPNKIFALKAGQADGNKVRLVWFYSPLEQSSPPVYFSVYCDGATGQIDDATALATIEYKGQKFYSYVSGTLQPGRYLFACKAKDADGNQHDAFAHWAIELDSSDPEGIDILFAETI